MSPRAPLHLVSKTSLTSTLISFRLPSQQHRSQGETGTRVSHALQPRVPNTRARLTRSDTARSEHPKDRRARHRRGAEQRVPARRAHDAGLAADHGGREHGHERERCRYLEERACELLGGVGGGRRANLQGITEWCGGRGGASECRCVVGFGPSSWAQAATQVGDRGVGVWYVCRDL